MNDWNLLERVPIQQLIDDEYKSDNDTERSSDNESVKSEEFLSDEEVKNNYSFLESFKKRKTKKNGKKKQVKLKQIPYVVKEDYSSE